MNNHGFKGKCLFGVFVVIEVWDTGPDKRLEKQTFGQSQFWQGHSSRTTTIKQCHLDSLIAWKNFLTALQQQIIAVCPNVSGRLFCCWGLLCPFTVLTTALKSCTTLKPLWRLSPKKPDTSRQFRFAMPTECTAETSTNLFISARRYGAIQRTPHKN